MATVKPQAALVAQLIATHMGLPQTRTLRRAGADYANSAYRRTETLGPAPTTRRDLKV